MIVLFALLVILSLIIEPYYISLLIVLLYIIYYLVGHFLNKIYVLGLE